MTYSFGVPAPAVWTSHILIGLFLFYVGYTLYNEGKINRNLVIVLMVLGVLALLYHSHLAYYYTWGGGEPVQVP